MSTKSPTPSSAEAAAESYLVRTLFVPILFVSFLFSLLWVDRGTSTEVFSHDDPKSNARKGSETKYYHSHQRKLAKKEFDDAFAYQGRVVAMLCIGGAFVLVGASWAIWRFWQWELGNNSYEKVR